MSDKNKLEYSVQTTLAECIQHLEELVQGLKSGLVVLQHRRETVELRPSAVVELGMKARQKGAKESLELELAWKRSEVAVLGGADALRISTQAEE